MDGGCKKVKVVAVAATRVKRPAKIKNAGSYRL
jgi:hypothetical protein